jgi:methionine synthase II (cobalamin-independent)
LETSVDILSFDAYNYAESLSLYPREVEAFIERGGIIAWGIVPNEEKAIENETVESIVKRLEQAMGLLSKKGLALERLLERCLITPSCGLASLSPAAVVRALGLLSGVSRELRKLHKLEPQA